MARDFNEVMNVVVLTCVVVMTRKKRLAGRVERMMKMVVVTHMVMRTREEQVARSLRLEVIMMIVVMRMVM